MAYETNRWKFDYTISYSGKKRLPSTVSNPAEHQRASYSPSFATMNAQVSKTLGKKNQFDIYLGGENLSNYFQKNAIIAATQPFSSVVRCINDLGSFNRQNVIRRNAF
ncbi:MAG: hypothetical protein WKG06_05210 [Segetibacter sp.]